MDALAYARQYFGPFSDRHMNGKPIERRKLNNVLTWIYHVRN